MDLTKVSLGMRVAGVSGFVLLLAMFLPWYGTDALVELPGVGEITAEGGNANAWESFSFADLLLFAIAVLAIVLALAAATGPPPRNAAVPPALVLVAAGAFAVVIILFRLIDPPSLTGDLASAVETDVGRRIGILFGLLAATGIAFGGYTALEAQDRERLRSRRDPG